MDVSVVIPVYNSNTTIIESVDSVVCECVLSSYRWELIIVDDGSRDNSVVLIEDYIASSPYRENVRLIKQRNGGAAVARNTGIKAAKGEFIAFNDSDDRWLKGRLKEQIAYMRANPEVVLLGCVYGKDNFQKGSFIKLGKTTRINIEAQVLKNYFAPPATVVRYSILTKSGLFHEGLRYAEEGYFFNNLVASGVSIFMKQVVAESITSKGRWGDSGLSGNLVKMEQGELFNIRSAYKLGYISFVRYVFAICFSLAKFVRRLLISKFRKISK